MRFLPKIVCLLVFLALADSGPVAADTKKEPPADTESVGEPAGETQEGVHERRMAQLRRLQDLAVANDRRDLISRVDGLIARELKRHSRERKNSPVAAKPEPAASDEQKDEAEPEPEAVTDEELEAEVEAMEEN